MIICCRSSVFRGRLERPRDLEKTASRQFVREYISAHANEILAIVGLNIDIQISERGRKVGGGNPSHISRLLNLSNNASRSSGFNRSLISRVTVSILITVHSFFYFSITDHEESRSRFTLNPLTAPH